MEVRCASCNKLFRVSDDKITGSGVKFPCTRCGESVKITRENFEQYLMSKSAPALASVEPAPQNTAAASPPSPATAKTSTIPDFGISSPSPSASTHSAAKAAAGFVKAAPLDKPASATAGAASEKQGMPGIKTGPSQPAPPKPEVKSPPKPMPQQSAPVGEGISGIKIEPRQPAAAQPKPEVKLPPKPAPAAATSATARPVREVSHPAPSVLSAAPRQAPGSSRGKKVVVLLVVLLVLGGAAFGVKFYLDKASQQVADAVKDVTSPDGLQVQNASGAVDPATGDLIITGTVENATDKVRPAWFIVADVYDAQGTVLIKAKLLSGKQLYTRRDYEIMVKRGMNVQDLKQKILQEQGSIIPAKGTVTFEMRIMEPPVGVASFNATLQPFDPVQLFKEMAEEQK